MSGGMRQEWAWLNYMTPPPGLINTLHLCLKKYCFSIHHLRFMVRWKVDHTPLLTTPLIDFQVHVVLFVKTVGVEYDVIDHTH